MDKWMDTANLIRFEMDQQREEGCDVKPVSDRFLQITGKGPEILDTKKVPIIMGMENLEVELRPLFEDLEKMVPVESFPYVEPSTLDAIRAERPDGPRRMELSLTNNQILNHISGAWLGRSAGCTLGKPVEGWTKNKIDSYLEFARALPLDDYIPMVEGHPEGYKLRTVDCARGNISYMARDDDMDYTILGLHILEKCGLDFTTENVADTWLDMMPYNLVYTAERVAYRNLVNHLSPPQSAMYQNPFREWIGAQIRADMWGYVCPGWPEKAAEFAFRDAAVSHVKNGIYGEMFVAAMLAAAFITTDVEEVIRIGLSEIPAKSRLAEAVHDTVEWCKQSDGWEQVWEEINEKYGHYSAVHTINNAALVVMAMMKGGLDYEAVIVASVRGGWDTDCNGATAGSVCGMMLGADALPAKWVGVLNDRIFSAVRGYNECKISELAKRSYQIARKVM